MVSEKLTYKRHWVFTFLLLPLFTLLLIPSSFCQEYYKSETGIEYEINEDLKTAENLFLSGEYTEVIDFLNQYITIHKDDADAYYLRALSWDRLLAFNNALEDYTYVIKLQPGNPGAYYKRGNIYKRLNVFGKAIRDYNKAVKLEPGNPELHFARAEIFDFYDYYEDAIENYTKAIDLSPRAEYYHKRGSIYLKIKEYEKSIKDLTRAINFNYEDKEVSYSLRGMCCYYLNRFEDAIKDCEKAIEINPDLPNPHFTLAGTYYTMEKMHEALAEFTKVIELDPNNKDAYFYRAKIHLALNNNKEYIEDTQILMGLTIDEPALNNGVSDTK